MNEPLRVFDMGQRPVNRRKRRAGGAPAVAHRAHSSKLVNDQRTLSTSALVTTANEVVGSHASAAGGRLDSTTPLFTNCWMSTNAIPIPTPSGSRVIRRRVVDRSSVRHTSTPNQSAPTRPTPPTERSRGPERFVLAVDRTEPAIDSEDSNVQMECARQARDQPNGELRSCPRTNHFGAASDSH